MRDTEKRLRKIKLQRKLRRIFLLKVFMGILALYFYMPDILSYNLLKEVAKRDVDGVNKVLAWGGDPTREFQNFNPIEIFKSNLKSAEKEDVNDFYIPTLEEVKADEVAYENIPVYQLMLGEPDEETLAIFRSFLESGMKLSNVPYDLKPILLICNSDNFSFLEEISKMKTGYNFTTSDYEYCLHSYITAGFFKGVKFLKKKFNRPEFDNEIKSVVHQLVSTKDFAWIPAAIKIGADVNYQDKYGVTPVASLLKSAAEEKLDSSKLITYLEIFDVLLANGADLSIKDFEDKNFLNYFLDAKNIPLNFLNKIVNTKTVPDSIKAEVCGFSFVYNVFQLFQDKQSAEQCFKLSDNFAEYFTPENILKACYFNRVEIVDFAFKKGINVNNLKDEQGQNCLSITAELKNEQAGRRKEMLTLLLSHGANINQKIDGNLNLLGYYNKYQPENIEEIELIKGFQK